jgi:HPt (histidine-containing phosphotransfer) domain-containing protein
VTAEAKSEWEDGALVDLGTARGMAEGCGWTLPEFAAFYARGAREEEARLATAIASGDVAEVERLAHGAKGSSGTAGAVGMMPLWGRMEQVARAGRTAELPLLLEEARERLHAVLRILDAAAAGDEPA